MDEPQRRIVQTIIGFVLGRGKRFDIMNPAGDPLLVGSRTEKGWR
jgi:hypothetical protein